MDKLREAWKKLGKYKPFAVILAVIIIASVFNNVAS